MCVCPEVICAVDRALKSKNSIPNPVLFTQGFNKLYWVPSQILFTQDYNKLYWVPNSVLFT